MISTAKSETTLIDYFEYRYSVDQLRHRADSTRSGYRKSIARFSEFLGGHALLADLNPATIESFENSLSRSGFGEKSLYRVVRRIRKMMRDTKNLDVQPNQVPTGIPNLPEAAYKFHYRVWGQSRLPCTVCGLTGHKGLHRAIRPFEKLDGAFVIRRSADTGGDYVVTWHKAGRPYSPRGRKVNRPPAGPTKRIAVLLSQAASLCAMGKTLIEAAESLGVTADRIHGWQTDHPELWSIAFDRTMEKVKVVVLSQIGAASVLDDPSPFLAMADRCHIWARSRGETLLPESSEMTLPKFYEEHYLPTCLFDARDSTIYMHRVLLRRWAFLTGNPPLMLITNETVVQFRNALAKMSGLKRSERMSPNTIRSYLRNIETFLAKAGPPCRGNRDALGFIKEVPWARPPKAILYPPRYVEAELINAVYSAAAKMQVPKIEGIEPAAWWRAVIVLVYNVAVRRGALFRLRMSDVDWNGYLQVQADGAKTSIGQAQPLNVTVIEHLQAIRTDREVLFPWPLCDEQFDVKFHHLQNLAGIPSQQHFGLHDLRRTASTVLWEDNPAAAQLMLGHTSSRTTQGHYVNSRGILARAAERMPQPAAFASAKKGGAA